jgi:hypothetical protein
MPLSRPLIFTLFLLLGIGPVLAQDAGGDVELQLSEQEKETLKNLPPIPVYQKRKPGEISFAVVAATNGKEDYFYIHDGKPEKLQLNTGTIRRFQHGLFPGEIVFYKMTENAKKEQILAPAAKADPGEAKDGIIVFSPEANKEGSGPATMPFIDLSKSSFSPGQVRMLNLTPLPLIARMDNKPAKVPSMESFVRTPNQSNGLFPLQIAITTDDKPRMIYSNNFQIEKSMRILFIIIPDRANANASSPARCMVYKDKGSVSQ